VLSGMTEALERSWNTKNDAQKTLNHSMQKRTKHARLTQQVQDKAAEDASLELILCLQSIFRQIERLG
jgi:hypothetical protein